MKFPYAAVFTTMCLHFQVCNSFNTITSTNFLSDAKNETLSSSDGNFKLGFFSPKNSLYRYVGVWFANASDHNLIWVANRNNPVRKQNGVFKIMRDGNIAVMNGETDNDIIIWSSNITDAVSVNATAMLLSSGNLVLKASDRSSQSDIVLWQSFDYPTDTFLAGMKVGLDRRTNMKRVLSSWKSENDPSLGEYSAAVEVYGLPQLFVYKNSDPVWRGGPWNGHSLSGVLDVAMNIKANGIDYANESSLFSYVNSTDEVYITIGNRERVYRTFVLDSTGIARQQLWQGSHANGTNRQEWSTIWVAQKDRCDEYMRCGPSAICNSYNAMECTCLPGYKPESPQDWYLNCVEKTEYRCGKGNGEGFIELSNLKLPDARIARFFDNLSLKECEMECLKDCNCTGYATDINAGGKGCYAWYGELNDIREYAGDGEVFYIRVDAPSLADNVLKMKNFKGENGKKMILRLIIGTTIPVIVVVLVSCFSLRWWRKHVFSKVQRQKQRYREKILNDSETDMSKDYNGRKFGENSNIKLTFFSLDTIVAATSNFSLGKKLGQGGFGPVYKGDLANGEEIAVKRQLKTSSQGISEFKNEALLIAKLQHKNLVRLLGCCIEDEEKILVYEYMENKSLDYFIFDKMRKSQLDWQKRHKIIVEVARGMMYLHHDSRLKVIHRDLKASNILLDKEMSAKISDFGTARIFGGNQYEDNTTKVVGTYGYMSPEYALYGYFSEKSDVFSFGVLLIEIISGRKNNNFLSNSSPSSNLICHVWGTWSDGRPLDIIDKLIGGSWPSDEVLRCIQVGLLCIQDNVKDRPTMKDVVFMLSNKGSLPSPKQPLFTTDSCQVNINSESPSTNDMTITLCAR